MKKRVLSLLSILIVLSFALVACGSKGTASKLDGTTWNLSGGKEEASGIEVTADQMAALGMEEFKFDFKQGGVATVTFAGESADGTFTEKDNEVTITSEGESITGTLEDNKLTISQDGMTLYFEKSEK
ncbi:hypothetical protein acsn021_43150 [Anaerocolumna cellulosilytica]|uniref:Uncharacterized protein n=1 Tax=Anaerocolumna cellulosilytica TaxID=433286 RepID=A0A6S6R3R0_9FIRM|nr:hypothetical protein [Anaerocolumna cellulosilytica]MBB5195273.1 hypothetical protein [Anaerocolumna cellulosilytica]BCJ96746.1 hypothetical protein acsn021_43150 [Anaerocolumna cellulosilytica]